MGIIPVINDNAVALFHGGYPTPAEARNLPSQFSLGFTADFLVSADRRIFFLEGGPPHHDGPGPNAHHCCFAPSRVNGLALAPQPGALTA